MLSGVTFVLSWATVALALPPDATVAVVPFGEVIAYAPVAGAPDQLAWITPDEELALLDPATGAVTLHPGYVAIDTSADVDGDGGAELFVRNEALELVQVAGPDAVATAFDRLVPNCRLTGADVDGDLFDDLVSLGDLLRGGPSGLASGGPLEQVDVTLDEPCGVAWSFGDVDGDGRAELGISRSTDLNVYGQSGDTHGSLTLYPGRTSAVVPWPIQWIYGDDATVPGTSLVPASVDDDSGRELVALSTSTAFDSVYGKLLLLDAIDDLNGPTVLAEQDINDHLRGHPSNSSPTPTVANLGDLDKDGDDEVVLLLDGYTDGLVLRVLDVEPETDGLQTVLAPRFDLPIPDGTELTSGYPRIAVGDYDGDGLLDLAVALGWTATSTEAQDEEGGTIAIWYGLTIRTANGFGVTPGAPLEEGCGCAAGPGSASPVLAALALVFGRRRARST